MFSFFKKLGAPKDIDSLSEQELAKVLADLPKKLEAKFNENPVENRLKFAAEFREKCAEWKATMNPELHAQCLAYADQIEKEGYAHIAASLVDYVNLHLPEWEKMDCPPFREIIRLEKDFTAMLGALDAIPDYMQKGAKADIELALQRLQKLQA